MHKTWISAALAPTFALLPGPLWAQQRAPTTVVACSGTFAKDSSHLELTTALKTLLSPMWRPLTAPKSRQTIRKPCRQTDALTRKLRTPIKQTLEPRISPGCICPLSGVSALWSKTATEYYSAGL